MKKGIKLFNWFMLVLFTLGFITGLFLGEVSWITQVITLGLIAGHFYFNIYKRDDEIVD